MQQVVSLLTVSLVEILVATLEIQLYLKWIFVNVYGLIERHDASVVWLEVVTCN